MKENVFVVVVVFKEVSLQVMNGGSSRKESKRKLRWC